MEHITKHGVICPKQKTVELVVTSVTLFLCPPFLLFPPIAIVYATLKQARMEGGATLSSSGQEPAEKITHISLFCTHVMF